MIFERKVGSDKNKHDIFFLKNWICKDASCYLRNEHLDT